MGFRRTDDPIRDHLNHEARRERALARLPICCECEHHIQSEELVYFDGNYICMECFEENHLKSTEDYVN